MSTTPTSRRGAGRAVARGAGAVAAASRSHHCRSSHCSPSRAVAAVTGGGAPGGSGRRANFEGAVAVELSRRAEDIGMAIAAPSAAAPIAAALPKMPPWRRGGWGCGPAPGDRGGVVCAGPDGGDHDGVPGEGSRRSAARPRCAPAARWCPERPQVNRPTVRPRWTERQKRRISLSMAFGPMRGQRSHSGAGGGLASAAGSISRRPATTTPRMISWCGSAESRTGARLHRMVEEGACIDVLTQVSAATGARSVAVALLEEHLRHCVAAHRLRRRRADRLRPRPAKQSNDW